MKQIDFDAIPDVRPATLTTSRDVLIQTIGEHINEARTINANWIFADTLTVMSVDGAVFVDGHLGPESESVDPVTSTDAYNVGHYALMRLGRRIGSVLAFRKRFASVKAQIELAATDNPNAPLEDRLKSAFLRSYLTDLNVSKHADLDDPYLQEGVRKMAEAIPLDADLVSEILDTPFTDFEAP